MVICSNCRTAQPDGNAFCDHCGAALSPTPPVAGRCPICKASIKSGQEFCGNCGAPLTPPPPPAADTKSPHCAQCGQPVSPTSTFCDRCGAALTARPAPIPCPRCGTANAPDSRFCENCGQRLDAPAPVDLPPTVRLTVGTAAATQKPTPQEPSTPNHAPPLPATTRISPVAEQEITHPVSPPVGIARLVVQGTGAVLPLPAGRTDWTIGRKDPNTGAVPDIDLTNHGGEAGGVSRRHARIIRQGDHLFVEDLNTVNHTYLNGQRLGPGQLYPLNEGDEIRLGRVKLFFYTRPQPGPDNRRPA